MGLTGSCKTLYGHTFIREERQEDERKRVRERQNKKRGGQIEAKKVRVRQRKGLNKTERGSE